LNDAFIEPSFGTIKTTFLAHRLYIIHKNHLKVLINLTLFDPYRAFIDFTPLILRRKIEGISLNRIKNFKAQKTNDHSEIGITQFNNDLQKTLL
jgi:hypothetical protein